MQTHLMRKGTPSGRRGGELEDVSCVDVHIGVVSLRHAKLF